MDSLRQLGFVVPAVHSNYCHTFLSLPSMINASHIAGLSGELGRRSVDRTVHGLSGQAQPNGALPQVAGLPLRVFSLTIVGGNPARPRADMEFHAWHGWDPAREVTRSGLRQVLNKTSLLKFVDGGACRLARDHVTRTFAAIAQIPKIPGPVFTFAHVMSPHDPYVFDRDCRPAHQDGRWQPDEAQSRPLMWSRSSASITWCSTWSPRCFERRSSRRSSSCKAITAARHCCLTRTETREKITLAAGKERLGAFGAYYLPDQGSEVFGDSVTIVNVMGNVLRFYLGADLASGTRRHVSLRASRSVRVQARGLRMAGTGGLVGRPRYKGSGSLIVSCLKRRRSESNRRIEVLQTSALPLGYGAGCCGPIT